MKSAMSGGDRNSSSGCGGKVEASQPTTFKLPLVTMAHMKGAIERLTAVSGGFGGSSSSSTANGGGVSVNSGTRTVVEALPLQAQVRK